MKFLNGVSFPETRLALFRITISFVILLDVFFSLPVFKVIFSIDHPLANLLDSAHRSKVMLFSQLIRFMGLPDQFGANFIYFIFVLSVVFMLFGFFTRASAVVAWLLHGVFLQTGSFAAFGFDFFLQNFLFYLICIPSFQSFSLDQKIRGAAASSEANALSVRILQIHFCIVYFFSGLTKLHSGVWLDGKIIWQILTLESFPEVLKSLFFTDVWIFRGLAWATILLEIAYPVFIFFRKTNRVWLFAIIALHVATALSLEFYLFSSLMILTNLCLFLPVDEGEGKIKVLQT